MRHCGSFWEASACQVPLRLIGALVVTCCAFRVQSVSMIIKFPYGLYQSQDPVGACASVQLECIIPL